MTLPLSELTHETCESCRCRQFVPSKKSPLLLCKDCQIHTTAGSLSPKEWYHLAVIHLFEYRAGADYPESHQNRLAKRLCSAYYYHDGEAVSPEIKRSLTADDALPSLSQIRSDLPRLVEYCLFPFKNLVDENQAFEALSSFSTDTILEILDACIKQKPTYNILAGSYNTYAAAILDNAGDWLKKEWERHAELAYKNNALSALIQASMRHLSPSEILSLGTPLFKAHPKAVTHLFAYPAAFKDVLLTWIETNMTPPYSPWGDKVARLGITWSNLEPWLKQGRPLSLVAMSALLRFTYPQYADQKLHEPESIAHMTEVLQQCVATDTAPNAIGMLQNITRAWDSILNPKPIVIKPEAQPPFLYYGLRRLKKTTAIKSYHIQQFILSNNCTRFQTKFGGQPDWLEAAQWPLSSADGSPLIFLGQISLSDPLFEDTSAKMAYIFVDPLVDPLFETDTVILQPGIHLETATLAQQTGPSVSENSYTVVTDLVDEPDYVPPYAEVRLLAKKKFDIYREQIDHDKIGGIPVFLQDDDYPDAAKEWSLLLQLSMCHTPFQYRDFDDSTHYVFISSDGKLASGILQNT